MYNYEKLNMKFYTLSFTQFFIFLTILFYKKILPSSWTFFFDIMNDNLYNTTDKGNLAVSIFFEIKLLQYINFFFTLYFYYIILLQTFIIFTVQLHIIYKKSKFETLTNYQRKQLYFVLLILSTIITPPDILSQLGLCISLICITELTIFTVIIKEKFQKNLKIKSN